MSGHLTVRLPTPQHFLDHLHLTDKVLGHAGVVDQLHANFGANSAEDAVYLSPLALGLAALLLLINGLLSIFLSLGLHKTLGIAALRQAPFLEVVLLKVPGIEGTVDQPLRRPDWNKVAG